MVEEAKNDRNVARVEAIREAVAACEGNLSEAADIFNSLGDYQDAAAQAEASYDDYYQDAYNTAKQAYADKNWQVVVETLEGLDLNTASAKYADLRDIWQAAAYEYAEQLYNDDKVFEAYAYYIRLEGYKDVSTKKLTRYTYNLFGAWENSKGEVFIFNPDGSCIVNGQDLFYFAKQYTLRTGRSPDSLDVTYRIVSVNANRLSLKVTSRGANHNKNYSLTRQKDTDEDE